MGRGGPAGGGAPGAPPPPPLLCPPHAPPRGTGEGAPAPPLWSGGGEEGEEKDEDAAPPLLEFHERLVNMRKNSSPKKPTTPAMMTAPTISCPSPLRIWVSSWPSTASISWSLSACRRPVVTVMEYCRRLRPAANAFSAGLSITFSFGIGMPREMQRFSRRL